MTIENDKPKVNEMPRPARAVGRQTIKSSIGRGVARTGGRLVSNLSRRSAMVLVNLLRAESRVAMLAVLRGVTRILMANLITAVITLIAFTLYDSIFYFRKERSGKQFLVDFISNVWVITCGTTFFIIWEMTPKAFLEGNAPHLAVIDFILGFAFSVVVCLIAGSLFDRIASRFYVSDADQMLLLIGEEYENYRLSHDLDHDHARELFARLGKLVTPRTVRHMFRSDDRRKFAFELICKAESQLTPQEEV